MVRAGYTAKFASEVREQYLSILEKGEAIVSLSELETMCGDPEIIEELITRHYVRLQLRDLRDTCSGLIGGDPVPDLFRARSPPSLTRRRRQRRDRFRFGIVYG